ncbi:hypothetical protein [Sulfurimonas sp.]
MDENDIKYRMKNSFEEFAENNKLELFQRFGSGQNSIVSYKNKKKLRLTDYIVELKISGECSYIQMKDQVHYVEFLQRYIPSIESLQNLPLEINKPKEI